MRNLNRDHWNGYWAGWCGGLGVYWILKHYYALGAMGIALSIFLLWLTRFTKK